MMPLLSFFFFQSGDHLNLIKTGCNGEGAALRLPGLHIAPPKHTHTSSKKKKRLKSLYCLHTHTPTSLILYSSQDTQ